MNQRWTTIAALCAGFLLVAQGVGTAAETKPTPKAVPASVDSVRVLEQAVAKDSTNFDLLYRLGVMYLDRDRPGDALAVFYRATKLRPKDVPALVNLGAAHDAEGQPNAAQESYRRALEIQPGDSVAVCRLASSLYANGKYDESVDMLRDLIAKKPGSYCAYFTMGVAFADAGIYREAMRLWQKVVDLAPESPEAVSAKESIEVLQKFVKMP